MIMRKGGIVTSINQNRFSFGNRSKHWKWTYMHSHYTDSPVLDGELVGGSMIAGNEAPEVSSFCFFFGLPLTVLARESECFLPCCTAGSGFGIKFPAVHLEKKRVCMAHIRVERGSGA